MNPQKMSFRAMFLLGVVVIMLIAAGVISLRQHVTGGGTVTIAGGVVVHVTVAATELTREQGLSGHPPLAPDEGMLFVFPVAGPYGFWMKDMLFPLDFIWIADGRIVDITSDAPAPVPGMPLPSYFPRLPVDRVLEVNAGFAASHGLMPGMPVEADLKAAK